MRLAAAALLLAACALQASAGGGLEEFAGFWSGGLKGFKGAYRVTLSVSKLNKSYYGSYSVLPPQGQPSRGTFSFEPLKAGCWAVAVNAPGGAPLRVREFCPRGGGVTFFVDGANLSVIAEPNAAGALDAIVSDKSDELRGALTRRTPREKRAAKAAAPEKPATAPLLNSEERPLRSKRPPKP